MGIESLNGDKLMDSLFDGVYFVDPERKITFWNSAAERITGYSKREVNNSYCYENLLRHIDSSGRHLCVEGCPLAETIHDGKIREASVFLHHKLGHRVPVSVRTAPVRDDSGTIIGAVEIFSDNSSSLQILQEYEQLKQEAFLDPLTNVGNRRYGDMNLSSRLYDFEHFSFTFGILFIDIDHFKEFNDTYGHSKGDEVLVMVARSIAITLRKIDILARWGGEEFIVILPVSSPETIKGIAERIRLLIDHSFIDIEGGTLHVTVSIGATVSLEGDTNSSLLSRADTLMYQSKRNGRNMVTYGDG